MIYEKKCSNCNGGGYFMNSGIPESCEKCKGWGVVEEEVEFSVWDGKTFIDVFQTNQQAQLALVDCANGRIEHNYNTYHLNMGWNFGRSIA